MEETRTRMLNWIAVVQLLPLLISPWTLTLSSLIGAGVIVLFGVFLGWALVTRKAWAPKMIIFTQGLNMVIRLLTFFSNIYRQPGGINWVILVTYVLSLALSWTILLYMDKPEVQLSFESRSG